MATARHRAIDRVRRDILLERKHTELGRELEIQKQAAESGFDRQLDEPGDIISCPVCLATCSTGWIASLRLVWSLNVPLRSHAICASVIYSFGALVL